MTRLLLIAAAVLTLAVIGLELAGAEPARPADAGRIMVDERETSTLRVAQWWNLFRQADGSWRTNTYATLALGPYDVHAGDVIDVRLFHEFDSEADGAGYWTVNGVKSEHWARWTMASTSVYLGTSAQLGAAGQPLPGGGARVMPPQEFNWDWYVHHGPVSRASLYTATADCLGCFLFDRVYFISGAAYTRVDGPVTNRQVQVNPGPYSELQAAIYR